MRAVKRVEGRAVVLDRPDIDTDQIIPASWLKRVERTGFGPSLFGAWRADPDFVLSRPGADEAKVLIAGPNFGCGSSREHAVWALLDFGFEAVIAPSFADIFRGNSIGAGLVTAEVRQADLAELISALGADPAATVVVDVAERTVAAGGSGGSSPRASTAGGSGGSSPRASTAPGFSFPFALPDYARWRLLEGLDDIAITLRHAEAISGYEQRRPVWLPSSRPQARAST